MIKRKVRRKIITEHEITKLVNEFANVSAQIKVLNSRKDSLKKRVLECDMDSLVADVGTITITYNKAPKTFDKAKAKGIMNEEEYESCFKIGKVPSPTVKFVQSK